jgi:hypothetical protein
VTSARDLLEAHAFRRRRLARAVFSSGSGLDGGSPGPARSLVVGAALAVLLVAASLLTGVTRSAHGPGGSPITVPTHSAHTGHA